MGVAPAELWSWGDEQVELLLASKQLDSEYGQYGEVIAEAMSSDANPNNYDSPFYYVAKGPNINWAERVVATAQDAFYKDSTESRAGHVWHVEKVPRVKPDV